MPYPAGVTKDQGGKAVSAARLFRYISEENLSQREFGDKIGVSEQTLTNWKSRGIPAARVGEVAHAMGLSYEQYLREADYRPPKMVAMRRAQKVATSEVVTVPMFKEVEASAGPGRAAPLDPVVGGLQLSRNWVRGQLPALSSIANLAVISAAGDSMTPTINDGDILLVDRGVTDVRADAVYVLGRGDDIWVKRLQRRLSGEIIIRSDNPILEPETVSGEDLGNIRILGRVVWAWNGRRL